MTTEAPVAGQATPESGVQPTTEGNTPAAQGTEATTTAAPAATEAAAAEAKTEAPAEIVYDFKMPEGMEADKPALEAFTAIAKEAKLSPEQAQKVVNLAAQREQARADAFNTEVKGWEESVKSDKELGGDKLADTLATCRKAIDLGPPELRDLLSATKMGSHPAVVKWAYAVGKALSEDKFVKGNPPPAAGSDGIAQSLYPNQSK